MRWDEYVGETVRVWDAQHSAIFTEGEVVAAHDGPVIWVRDSDGALQAHVMTLPIEVMRWVPGVHATPRSRDVVSGVGDDQ